MKTFLALAAASAAILAGPALAKPEGAKPTKERVLGVESRIPFVSHGGVRNFEADGTSGLWIQDDRNKWHYATLIGPCSGLSFATSLGFVTRGSNTLDSFGEIIAEGDRCAIQRLVTSAGPPPKAKKGAAQADKANAKL